MALEQAWWETMIIVGWIICCTPYKGVMFNAAFQLLFCGVAAGKGALSQAKETAADMSLAWIGMSDD
tara:strand:- start:7628 stop:7828 length:201 start_codon:yes stop_codon:yes gene_type:complete